MRLELEYEPEGLVEKAGDALNLIEKRAEGDLEKFKELIESRGFASGAWRGEIPAGTPGIEAAAQTRGDSGKVGVTGKVAAGAAVVAGAAAAAAAGKKSDEKSSGQNAAAGEPAPVATGETVETRTVPVEEVVVVERDADRR